MPVTSMTSAHSHELCALRPPSLLCRVPPLPPLTLACPPLSPPPFQARDINLDIKRVVAYRHWCNKLWNAIKFAMMNLPDGFSPATHTLDPATLPTPSRWILAKLSSATATVVKAMEEYDFATATQRLYSFWQYEVGGRVFTGGGGGGVHAWFPAWQRG